MSRPTLPPDHHLRRELAEEVHARPPAAIEAAAVASFIALTDARPDELRAALLELARQLGVPVEQPVHNAHMAIEAPRVRIKWEGHGEFSNLTLVASAEPQDPARPGNDDFPSAFNAVPAEWLARLPGTVIAAGDILVLPMTDESRPVAAYQSLFAPDAMVGAAVLEEAAWLFTDFHLKESGRTRWLILDARLGRAQTARVVQRVVDIEVYRMMALLAFPLARAAFGELNRIEHQLERMTAATADLAAASASAATHGEERRLLDELSRVAAELERLNAATAFRYSASQAYWDIVLARVGEFRERRLGDLRTLSGFLNRRLAPAMNSCAAAARRQDALAQRIERAGSLLRTRVDVAREEQNQRLLAAMDRRSKLQLRLQQTVEGLSVAAIAYYVIGLLAYLLKPLPSLWPSLQPEWIIAGLVPIIAFLVLNGMRRVRRRMESD